MEGVFSLYVGAVLLRGMGSLSLSLGEWVLSVGAVHLVHAYRLGLLSSCAPGADLGIGSWWGGGVCVGGWNGGNHLLMNSGCRLSDLACGDRAASAKSTGGVDGARHAVPRPCLPL